MSVDPSLADPLVADPPAPPERVHYHTGVMLDREDFRAEQTYHRARLARLARYLHGAGTVAGLKLTFEAGGAGTGHEPRLRLSAGIACDRFGRLVELFDDACIRIDAWLTYQNAQGRLRFRPAVGGSPAGVIADAFLAFRPLAHGLTPAIATGALDALDAAVPARIRDACELVLVPREEDAPPLPGPALPADLGSGLTTLAARRAALHAWKRDAAWDVPSQRDSGGSLRLLQEHVRGVHQGHELFLARVAIPGSVAVSGLPPVSVFARSGAPAIDDSARPFAYATAELAWLFG